MEKTQREFLLRQQMAAIRKELGDDEGEAADGYRTRLAEIADQLPEGVATAIEKEIDKLERTSPQNTEYGWIETWLDTVFELPWATRTDDHLDLTDARAVLDADHNGLDEVKDRIVEFLAVRRLRAERGLDARRRRSHRHRPTARWPSRSPTRPSPAVTAAGTAPSSRSSGPPASARPASASPSPGRSAASSCGSPWAACTTRPRSAATGAPTSAPAPAASSGR